jgi:hypothetical protein
MPHCAACDFIQIWGTIDIFPLIINYLQYPAQTSMGHNGAWWVTGAMHDRNMKSDIKKRLGPKDAGKQFTPW